MSETNFQKCCEKLKGGLSGVIPFWKYLLKGREVLSEREIAEEETMKADKEVPEEEQRETERIRLELLNSSIDYFESRYGDQFKLLLSGDHKMNIEDVRKLFIRFTNFFSQFFADLSFLVVHDGVANPKNSEEFANQAKGVERASYEMQNIRDIITKFLDSKIAVKK